LLPLSPKPQKDEALAILFKANHTRRQVYNAMT
jgi:hypothetical protein